jgi:hypothetical protein
VRYRERASDAPAIAGTLTGVSPVGALKVRLPNGETIDVEDRIRFLIELGKQAFLI